MVWTMSKVREPHNVYQSASIVANVESSDENKEDRGATYRHSVHSLRIMYMESGRLHDFTVRMKADDLADLRTVLDSVERQEAGPDGERGGAPGIHPVVSATAGVFAGRGSSQVDLDELLDRAREDRARQILLHEE